MRPYDSRESEDDFGDSKLVKEQQPPQPGASDCWKLVIEDMEARRLHGIEKYGVPVQVGNGRDALRDLTEELLDAIVYLRQFREEMRCLGNDLKTLHALLVAEPSREREGHAEAVSLLEQILQRNPVLHAG